MDSISSIHVVGTICAVANGALIDVLVIGSGASGLAAAVSAEGAGARVAVATKTTLQANNSSKAQGGIQAAVGEDDSPDLHAEDVMRSSHDTADPRLVEVLTTEAPSAIAWLEERGCGFTRENGGYRLARCGGATRRRLLQVGDRTGHAITKALRESFEAVERRDACASPAHATRADRWRLASVLLHSRRERRDRRDDRGPGLGRPLLRGGRRRAASSPRTIRTRPARRPGSRSTQAPRRATSMRSSTTRTAALGPPRCRATRSPRRRAPTAPCS